MTETNCKINPNKSAKPQALQFINDLKAVLPIKRSSMHLKVTFASAKQQAALTLSLLSLNEKEVSVSKAVSEGDVYQTFYTIDPSLFREINTLVKVDGQDDYKEVTIEIVDAVSSD